MEYLVFRILRLMDREIFTYKKLYECTCRQQKLIMQSDILDLLVVMVEQKETIAEITKIEDEILEELGELAIAIGILQEAADQIKMVEVIEKLKATYPKLASMLENKTMLLNLLLDKTNVINSQNISELGNCKELWKEHPPLYQMWKEFEPYWENESPIELKEDYEEKYREEPVYA